MDPQDISLLLSQYLAEINIIKETINALPDYVVVPQEGKHYIEVLKSGLSKRLVSLEAHMKSGAKHFG